MSSLTLLNAEISFRIAKAAAVLAKLNKGVWSNDLLSERTTMCIYQAFVLSTLLHGSESRTTYARQERRLNGFHLRCLQHLLHIRWQDRVTNTKVLECAGSLSMRSLLIQRHLRWLGHAHRMEPDRLTRNPLRRTAGGCTLCGSSTARPLQGRHQARLAICTNRHQCMGGHQQTPRYMAAKCQSGVFQRRKRTLESRLHAREQQGKNTQPLRAIPQGTSAPPATETATPGSGYSHTRSCPNPQC